MAFQNKDLLVSVLPKLGIGSAELAKICLFRTYICRFPTWCFHATCLRFGTHCGACTFLVTFGGGGGCQILNSCGPGGSACDPTIFCYASDPFVIEDIEDLVTIRAELKATLARLEEIEKGGGLESRITSRADADAMERQLNEALALVKKRKGELK